MYGVWLRRHCRVSHLAAVYTCTRQLRILQGFQVHIETSKHDCAATASQRTKAATTGAAAHTASSALRIADAQFSSSLPLASSLSLPSSSSRVSALPCSSDCSSRFAELWCARSCRSSCSKCSACPYCTNTEMIGTKSLKTNCELWEPTAHHGVHSCGVGFMPSEELCVSILHAHRVAS